MRATELPYRVCRNRLSSRASKGGNEAEEKTGEASLFSPAGLARRSRVQAPLLCGTLPGPARPPRLPGSPPVPIHSAKALKDELRTIANAGGVKAKVPDRVTCRGGVRVPSTSKRQRMRGGLPEVSAIARRPRFTRRP